MKIQQLSLFLENRPGQLNMALRLLAQAGVDIKTLSLADTEQFGILRLIVRDWQRAKQVLEEAHCVVKMTEVLAVEVADRPGGLNQILDVADQAGINVEYMYAFAFGRGDKAVIIFRFEDVDAAVRAMQAAGINVLDSVELYERVEK